MPEPLPDSVKLESGYTLQLAGGLTEAGRSQLEAGERGYFVLAYAGDRPIPTEGVEIGDMIGIGVFFALVEPGALASLQEQASRGALRYAGPLPPEAKLAVALAEEMKFIAPDTRLRVMIRLIAPLDEAQRAALSQWLVIESESNGPILLVRGNIESQYVSHLLTLPVIRLVNKVVDRRP